MTQTPNYYLNKFESTDAMETTSREGLNANADTIDTALKGLQDDIDEILQTEDISNKFTITPDLGLSGRISAFYQPATRKVYGTIALYTASTTIGTNTPYVTVSQAYRPSTVKRYAALVKKSDNTVTPYDIKIATNGEITQMLSGTSTAIYAGYFEYYISGVS